MAMAMAGEEARFLRCEAQGRYDHVPAAEACSIAVAQRIGVYSSNAAYFIAPFSTSTKTFSEDAVASAGDRLRPAMLCSASAASAGGDVAFPLCGVIAGPASARVESPDGTAACVTSECPPGFAQEGGNCVRPVLPSATDKTQRCDARWYDWFMVENAHLGNGAQADAAGTCYLPCPAGFVPNVSRNPVDGAAKDLVSRDDLGSCVPKSEFFFRKYAGTPDFCPLAWIHRLTTRPEDFGAGTEAAIAALREGGAAVSEATARQAAAHAEADSGALYAALVAGTDAQIAGGNAVGARAGYLQACKALNTPERLRHAFAVCEPLRSNPAAFKAKWSVFWGDRTDERMALLKKACNLVCCDENNAASIGARPSCFAAADLVAPRPAAAKAATKADARAKLAESEGYASPAQRTFFRSFAWLVALILVPVFAVVLWLALAPVARWLWRLWAGVGSCEGIDDVAVRRACERGELAEAREASDDRSLHWKAWVDRAGQVLAGLATYVGAPLGRVLGWAGDKATSATGSVLGEVGHTFMDGFVSNVLASLSVVASVVLLFAVAMFVYFYFVARDVSLGGGSAAQGFAGFLNAFNWRDWEVFNWREFWAVRAVNDLVNPYRAMMSPDAIPRGVLKAGRCDNVEWVEGRERGMCQALVKPAPIRWALSYPEGSAVPSTLRGAFPAEVAIPWEASPAGFVPSCDVAVTSADGATTRQLLEPLDDGSCALARTDAPAFVDRYRPKRGADGYAGLDGFADASDPKC